MAREGSVTFKFLADIRDLRSKLGDATKDVGKFTSGVGSSVKKGLSNLSAGLKSSIGSIGGELGSAFQGIEAGAAGGGPVGAAAAAGAAAITVLTGAAAKGISIVQDLASQIRSVERASGATAEESSRLVAVMRALNIDTTAGNRAFFLLSKTIDTNASKLTDHGIQIARNSDGNVDLYKTLLNVRAAYQAAGNAQEGNAISAAAFGKSGQALLPILTATAGRLKDIDEAAKEHHEFFSQAQLDQAKELSIAHTELSHAIQGVEIEVGSRFIPVMTASAHVLTTVTEVIDSALGTISRTLGKMNALLERAPGVAAIEHLIGSHLGLSDAAKKAAASEDDFAGSVDTAGEAASAADDALKAYNDSLDSSLGARLKLSAAERALSDAEKQYDEDLKGTAATAKSFEDQMSSTFDSVVDVDEAQIRARDSARALGDALKEAGQGSEDAAAFMKRYYEGTAAGASDKGDRIREAADQAVKAAEAEVDAMAKSGQIDDTAAARKAALTGKLRDLEKQYPAVKGQIDGFIASLAKVPNASTEAQIAAKKLGDAKKDLAKDSDNVIQAAKNEADAQATLQGKYTTFLNLLDQIKKKYPELAGAATQAAADATKAWDEANAAQAAALGPSQADAAKAKGNAKPGTLGAAADSALRFGVPVMAQQITNHNNTVNITVPGSDLDGSQLANLMARSVLKAIGGKR